MKGVKYIMKCTQCGKEFELNEINYFLCDPDWEKCWDCYLIQDPNEDE